MLQSCKMSVVIESTLGDITVDLYVNERRRTCLNFLKLCKVKYYNNCLFHNVQRSFIAQTGDPTGTGQGGESIYRTVYGDQAKFFEAEKVPKIKHKQAGMISMVNDGNGFHGSQFLITLANNLDSLDGVHTVFGEVAEGMEVIMKINEAFCDKDNRPYQDIRITHTVILDDPFDDPEGLAVPDQSPEPTQDQISGYFRIGADESINDDDGLNEEEIKNRESKKEAQHSAQVLEIIGDIPDKDVKPPDNVLFVCKLNSVTTDEDLEIIFSRFGTILSCEVIRDFKSGDSLQYAFIEFETAEMCEKAYKKMDNVLIDDRRIHVDFSQSVSQLKYRRSNKIEDERKRTPSPPKRGYYNHHHNSKRDDDNRPTQRHYDVNPKRSHHDQGSSKRRHREEDSPDGHYQKRKHDIPTHRHRHHKKHSSEKSHKHYDKMKEGVAKKSKKRKTGSDDELYSDREVRCGKHRKKSVQKDERRYR